jgi:hypothetical protein
MNEPNSDKHAILTELLGYLEDLYEDVNIADCQLSLYRSLTQQVHAADFVAVGTLAQLPLDSGSVVKLNPFSGRDAVILTPLEGEPLMIVINRNTVEVTREGFAKTFLGSDKSLVKAIKDARAHLNS